MINAVVFGIVLSQQNALEKSLMRSPETADFWRSILKEVSGDQKAGAEFPITKMPEADLRSFSRTMFTQNLALAYQARNSSAWAKAIPQDVFFNDVAPYASVTEPRNPMRQEFFTKYLPLVKNAKTSGEAALLINANLFKDYKVTYNTRRLRTDQNSRETIGQEWQPALAFPSCWKHAVRLGFPREWLESIVGPVAEETTPGSRFGTTASGNTSAPPNQMKRLESCMVWWRCRQSHRIYS
ncbi:MAG: hypothetical protein R2688_00740 [Fimbriimonadaceae bacterium]